MFFLQINQITQNIQSTGHLDFHKSKLRTMLFLTYFVNIIGDIKVEKKDIYFRSFLI